MRFLLIVLILLCTISLYQASAQSEEPYWLEGEITNYENLSYSHPALIDFVPDPITPTNGIYDVISGAETGTLRYQFNLGTNNTEYLLEGAETAVFSDVYQRAAVTAVDYNGDGRDDLLVGDQTGDVHLYLNTGDNFSLNSSLVAGVSVDEFAKAVAVFLNNDSVLDIVVGSAGGELVAFVNQGTWDSPDFERNDNLFSNFIVGNHPVPYPIDPDNDGIYSFIVGSENNGISILQATDEGDEFPKYDSIPYQNDVNPFLDLSLSDNFHFITPSMLDLNEDGFLDLIFGSQEGGLHIYYNMGYDFASISISSGLFGLSTQQLLLIGLVIAIISIGLTTVVYRTVTKKRGKPLFLMLVQDIGTAPYRYEFTEELVKDITLVGGAMTGIQAIINEITSTDLNSMEAGENRILITRHQFPTYDGNVQVLLWSTEDDSKLRQLSENLAEYVANNLEPYFMQSTFDQVFNNVVTSKIEDLFSSYL